MKELDEFNSSIDKMTPTELELLCKDILFKMRVEHGIETPCSNWADCGNLIDNFGISLMSRKYRSGAYYWYAQIGDIDEENETLSYSCYEAKHAIVRAFCKKYIQLIEA